MKTNFSLYHAISPHDYKGCDTACLRQQFIVNNLFQPDQVGMAYSMHDRLIVGGAMPVREALSLEAVDILRADHFCQRREVGIINVGGSGSISVDGAVYALEHKEALYIGRGSKDITFHSDSPDSPALFYFNSAPAHAAYPVTKITKRNAIVLELGSEQECNRRRVNRMLVQEVLPTCQLQMGLTELAAGSVWNTMPAHTHERRMEAYFYFGIAPEQAVCHLMGEPQETRCLWLHNNDAVISPPWSIHSACGTAAYSFIWGMAGENFDYTDMDVCPAADLR